MARKPVEHEHCACVADLESEVRHLKRKLAQGAERDPLAASGKPVKRTGADPYGLDGLADQDRRFLEKRLGIKRDR